MGGCIEKQKNGTVCVDKGTSRSKEQAGEVSV